MERVASAALAILQSDPNVIKKDICNVQIYQVYKNVDYTIRIVKSCLRTVQYIF